MSVDPRSDSHRPRGETWKEFVVPTAKGLETFFWRVAWFAVIMALLFSVNPFH